MNKTNARKIAEFITNEQLQQMLDKAKIEIKDWTKVSSVNKGMTKGTSWNILASDFDVNKTYHIIAKTNMIREFGEYLPENLKIKKIPKDNMIKKPIHQEPKF